MGLFDILGGATSKEIQNAHEEGQKDGSEGRSLVVTDLKEVGYSHLSGELGEAYRAGVNNGRNNQPKE